MRALFRLFVAAPPTLKHLALAGRPEEIEAAALFYAENISQDIVAFAQAVEAKHKGSSMPGDPDASRAQGIVHAAEARSANTEQNEGGT